MMKMCEKFQEFIRPLKEKFEKLGIPTSLSPSDLFLSHRFFRGEPYDIENLWATIRFVFRCLYDSDKSAFLTLELLEWDDVFPHQRAKTLSITKEFSLGITQEELIRLMVSLIDEILEQHSQGFSLEMIEVLKHWREKFSSLMKEGRKESDA